MSQDTYDLKQSDDIPCCMYMAYHRHAIRELQMLWCRGYVLHFPLSGMQLAACNLSKLTAPLPPAALESDS